MVEWRSRRRREEVEKPGSYRIRGLPAGPPSPRLSVQDRPCELDRADGDIALFTRFFRAGV
ncbi:MAG TPA: hypothetical protein VHL31_14950 [Geminicoccus sp.]|uniref:hypothetical protein n=1 Tax=Geminicoccus sp. TaxID=2024832 RepID=UPI002E366090|nr:hypothetical protein [Geminicoccus sp.]HEX2527580.1 hypothetical protein [Geminicoccus sp.]